jgi:hypothetical protein
MNNAQKKLLEKYEDTIEGYRETIADNLARVLDRFVPLHNSRNVLTDESMVLGDMYRIALGMRTNLDDLISSIETYQEDYAELCRLKNFVEMEDDQ